MAVAATMAAAWGALVLHRPGPSDAAPRAVAARTAEIRGPAQQAERRLPRRPSDRRRALAAELPAESVVGAWVRDAMLEPGDSDPRLLAALDATGLRPTDLAPVAAAVDPWLVAALVDLERQIRGEVDGEAVAAGLVDANVGDLVRALGDG